jgi:hypothetical protein
MSALALTLTQKVCKHVHPSPPEKNRIERRHLANVTETQKATKYVSPWQTKPRRDREKPAEARNRSPERDGRKRAGTGMLKTLPGGGGRAAC